jgi:antitoxin component YwqK of YwqJK toxin-antitoxin module
MRDGLLYETGTRQQFSGTVLGKSRREDYRTFPVTFKKEYKNGRLHGKSYFWYENGKVESVEPYQNGLINGAVTRYYENGQRKARIHFTEGMRGGNMGENFWDVNGKKIKR